jgi:hypothetical protein
MSTQLHEILHTDSKDMLVLYLPLHRGTTTGVQMAAPVPEIMDTPCTRNFLSLLASL